eukprot:31360-Pelagococcus_subviridis.AAC.3
MRARVLLEAVEPRLRHRGVRREEGHDAVSEDHARDPAVVRRDGDAVDEVRDREREEKFVEHSHVDLLVFVRARQRGGDDAPQREFPPEGVGLLADVSDVVWVRGVAVAMRADAFRGEEHPEHEHGEAERRPGSAASYGWFSADERGNDTSAHLDAQKKKRNDDHPRDIHRAMNKKRKEARQTNERTT